MHNKKESKYSGLWEELPNGKATESLLMRFNPREYELLNRAFSHVPKLRSRHAWLHDVLMTEARRILEQEEGKTIDPSTNLPSDKA